ncbi:hypothetical protein ANN_20202, partial [Periplaneta americana]
IIYLGVHLDRRLSWKHHINNKLKLAYSRLAKLYPLLNKKSSLKLQNCMLLSLTLTLRHWLLYTSLLRPLLLYACPVWGGVAISEIKHIQSFQNKVLNSPWFVRNSQLHRETGIDTIKQCIHSQAKNLDHVYEKSPTFAGTGRLQPNFKRMDLSSILADYTAKHIKAYSAPEDDIIEELQRRIEEVERRRFLNNGGPMPELRPGPAFTYQFPERSLSPEKSSTFAVNPSDPRYYYEESQSLTDAFIFPCISLAALVFPLFLSSPCCPRLHLIVLAFP